MGISVTGSGATRNGANITYYVSFKVTGNDYYIQLRDGDGRHTSAANPNHLSISVSNTVTRTVYSPGAGSATQSASSYYQSASGGSMTYWDSTEKTVSWSAMQLTVTFDPGQGTTPTASKTVTYDSTYGELPTPVRSGYAFVGWFTEGGTEIKATDTVAITADTTLYAHWEAMSILHVAEGGETKTVTNIQTVEGGSVKKVIGCYAVENGVVHQGI